MKNIFFYFTLLATVQLKAFVVTSQGGWALRNPTLKAICQQMTSDHMVDIDSLNNLYTRFKKIADKSDLVDRSDEISRLVQEISDVSERIRFLASPEWNSETIAVEIKWTIPNSLFFDDTAYLDLKQRVRKAPFGKSPELGLYVLSNRNLILKKTLIKSIFLGSENTEVAKYLLLKPFDARGENETDHSFSITYEKSVTMLEACQFLKTLKFDVRVNYVQYLMGIEIYDEKTLSLVYRNEDSRENR